jgi:hypothetical protein
MKAARSAFIAVCVLCALGCASDSSTGSPAGEILALYRSQSDWTDPGTHVHMYSDLPRSERRLCELIKCQLIHPFDLPKFHGDIADDWRFEDLDFPTVGSMLAGLAERGRPELSLARSPGGRLMVACWHHGLLLASMLRHQGVPVRLRAGFARYIGRGTGLHVGHVVCEVWDERRNRWFLVDPDRQKVDFPRHEFEFASEAWESLRNGGDVSGYRSAHYEGTPAILHLLSVDMRSVLRQELPYWHDPETVPASAGGLGGMGEAELDVLDRVASCLRDVDASLDELRELRTSSAFLREVDHLEEFRSQLPD